MWYAIGAVMAVPRRILDLCFECRTREEAQQIVAALRNINLMHVITTKVKPRCAGWHTVYTVIHCTLEGLHYFINYNKQMEVEN